MKPEKDLRLVRVGNELGYFHCWEQYAQVCVSISDSMINSSPEGQYARTFGIVEFTNRVARVEPEIIAFVDDINADLWSMNKHYQEKQTKEKLEQLEEMLREKSK